MSIVSFQDIAEWIAAILAFLVSLLTLYNAAKLRTGILAVVTYAFGAGMLCLALAFLLGAVPPWTADFELIAFVNNFLYIFGFLLLGYGTWRMYQMSKL